MVLVQKWAFSHFFLGNKDHENVFYDILGRKMPFQAIKTRRSKSRKIDIFVKGLTPSFGPKMVIFPNFFFQAIQTRNMSFTIFLKDKMPLQSIKTRSSKSQKIDIFFKRLPMVLAQIWLFLQLFFLGNKDQENVFYDILEREKRLYWL